MEVGLACWEEGFSRWVCQQRQGSIPDEGRSEKWEKPKEGCEEGRRADDVEGDILNGKILAILKSGMKLNEKNSLGAAVTILIECFF